MLRRGGKTLVNKLKFVLSQEHPVLVDNSFEQLTRYLTLVRNILKVQGSIDVLPLVRQLLPDKFLKLSLLVLNKN